MPRTILIVDDNAINRELLRHTLDADYQILEASDGEEALSVLKSQGTKLSAALLDIVMPKLDGYGVLTAMRADADLEQIPVIMVTGSEDESSRVKALTLGANDFILKPFNPDIVRHCLKNNIALRETSSTLHAIRYDRLTGLLNREAFFDAVTEMVAAHEPGHYLLSSFDIDNFKLVNDQYGAVEGDRILREVGRVVNEDMAKHGGTAGRISADNFAILLPLDSKDLSITRFLQQDRMAFSDKQAVVFSVGRYVINDLTLPASAIYDRAYIAKQSVKGRYAEHIAYFDERMLEKLIRDQQIIADMDTAIAEHQFEVWFQPQHNHSTGALVGSEALVRWRHPQKGIIPPGDFIPLFEQNGFIYELDKYVWAETCRHLRVWLDEGRAPVPVSVNMSRYDLFRPDVVDYLTGLLAEHRIPVEMLRLEITESAFAKSTKEIVKIVRTLIDHGFTVEIDDFGSGYSSFNTLKSVPAQVLKIDLRFLQEGDGSNRTGNILESIVRMTKWLGMNVIAEGVEEKKQADYLASIGCSYIQGYLYARPMPVSEYVSYCARYDKEKHFVSMETVEHLDNNAFWDPESMDTLIFNSYVNAACIFEHYQHSAELLRVNHKFTALLGDGTLSSEEVLRLDWLKCLSPQSLAEVRDVLEKSVETGQEYTCEYVFLHIPGGPEKTYLRATMRVIAISGERQLVYCTAENVTAQRQAEEKERQSADALRETDEQLRFLSEMSHDLLTQPDIEVGIDAALRKLMIYFQGRRAYIFEFDNGTRCARNTYEVCVEGVSAQMENLHAIPFSLMGHWFDAFERDGYYAMEDTRTLGDDRAEERSTLLAQGISSLYAVPLRCSGTMIGMLGIDDPRRSNSQWGRLTTLGDYIAVLLIRRDLTARAALTEDDEDRARLELLANNIPGGMAVYEGSANATDLYRMPFFSDGLCRLFGYTHAEYRRVMDRNVLELVHPDDLPAVQEQIKRLLRDGTPIDLVHRGRVRDGAVKWIHVRANMGKPNGNNITVNAIFLDVTARQTALERLRVSEEVCRLAIEQSQKVLCLYDLATKNLKVSSNINPIFATGPVMKNIPDSLIQSGTISPDTLGDYASFYERIRRGDKTGKTLYHRNTSAGWRWIEGHFTTIFSGDGKPDTAVITFLDMTESVQKDLAYQKWQQSIHDRRPETFSLYRCNVTRDLFIDNAQGTLLTPPAGARSEGFALRAGAFAQERVFPEDRERFLSITDRKRQLLRYHQGKRAETFDFRVLCPGGGNRWMRMTVDLVASPSADEVEGYLLIEDINEQKQSELQMQAQAENDPLTGVLNRAAFAKRADELLSRPSGPARNALLMLDIDGFKLVNDVFGHSVGDHTLIDIAGLLCHEFRQDDLIGRLGGDEFVILLHDIPDASAVAKSARRVCALTRKALSVEVQISGSIGIALSPQDGTCFQDLYHKADEALYRVKDGGKDGFAFYENPADVALNTDVSNAGSSLSAKKRRILIVDDNKLDTTLLSNLFREEYLIEKASDGNTALIKLHHYGSAISVVLLDLIMPGLDGFAVLKKMQQTADMRSIPVIVVSGADDPQISLRAIRAGASDFVTKPVDADVLRIRVESAISKTENERLRIKNSFLELQEREINGYKTALERTGTLVIVHDWTRSTFLYSPSVQEHLAGTYDSRPLWRILLSDLVTDSMTVQRMQQLVHDVANDRKRSDGRMNVPLKAATGGMRTYEFNVYKQLNEFGLTDLLVLTLRENPLPNENA